MNKIIKHSTFIAILIMTSTMVALGQAITSTNPLDFAPGPINAPTVSAYNQMLSYPLPRFKTGHNFMPNVPVFGNTNMGLVLMPGANNSVEMSVQRAILLQKQMCEKWNYALGFNNDDVISSPLIQQRVQLANENPQFKRSIITYWSHIGFDSLTHPSVSLQSPLAISNDKTIYMGNHPIYTNHSGACAPSYMKYSQYVKQQFLADNYYIRNASGRFLNRDNEPIYTNDCTLKKRLSPAAPNYIFGYDGQLQKNKLDLISALLVPRAGSIAKKFDLIVENGEELELIVPGMSAGSTTLPPVVMIDPNIAADFTQFAAGSTTGLAWQTYFGRRFTEFTNAYTAPFKSHYEQQGTLFTHYAIDGHGFWRPKYAETRNISSPIRGMKYATPDFYPHPQNWRGWWSAWHGWEWIAACRENEIAIGDSLFSPFVTAGWSGNEAQNIRPGYWLGLMKCLSVAGAEFFYPSYFSGLANQWNNENPESDVANFIWQASTPVYAQALSTHYADLIFNGHLLQGDRLNAQNASVNSYSFKAYNLGSNTPNENTMVVARKHNLLQKYVITASVQPNIDFSYMPNAEILKTTIANDTLILNARKQGSTYIYDKSNAQNPVFYQLDAWHEGTHPMYWSKYFKFDAEVADNMRGNMTIKTERPDGVATGNYTQFTSYVTGAGTLEYTFEPRQTGKYYISFLARSKSGLNTPAVININGMPKTVYVSGQQWSCYSMAQNNDTLTLINNTIDEPQLLIIKAANPDFEIDAILVTQTPNQCPTNYSISCNKPFNYNQSSIGGAMGAASYNASTNSHTLTGAGNAMNTATDRCFFANQIMVGDAEFTVKIKSIDYTDGNAKVGIMLRADLAPDAPNVLLAATPINLVGLQYRTVRSGNTVVRQTQRQSYSNNNMSHWLRIKRNGKRFDAYYSTDNTNWTMIDTVRIADFPNEYLVGLSISSNLSQNADQTSATVTDFTLTQCPTQPMACIVPFDFIDAPLGNGTGNTMYNANTKTYTINATGNALSTNQDNCHYNFTTLKGNAEMTMRITDLSYTDGQTKAGIMLRTGLQTGNVNVFLGINPLGQVYFQGRNINNANTGISAITPQGSTTTNNWLKIKRTDNYFQAYWSNNNDNWVLVGAVNISNFPSSFLAGIATTSNSNNTTTANIDNLSIQNCQTNASCELPFNYVTQNVGGTTGSTTNNSTNGTYAVAGAGSISGTDDAFQYAFKNMFGDIEVSMKINSLTYIEGTSKAGIMLRAGLATNAPNVYLAVTPINWVYMQHRTQAGNNTTVNLHQNLSNFNASNMSHWLKIRRVGDVFKSYWSMDNVNWTALDSVTIVNFPKNYLVGVAVASNNSTATRAIVSNLLMKRCIEPDCNQVFSPYNNAVGGAVGTVNTGLAGGYILASTGNDLFGTTDDFTFAARNISQNAEIVTKINSLTYTNAQAKAGLCMRTTLAPDAPMVFVGVTPTNQVYFMHRTTTADTTIVALNIQKGSAQPTNMAHWLKLRRINNTFEAYYSIDNSNWEALGSVNINSFAQNYLIGLGTTANASSTTTAVFDNVSIAKCLDGNANQPIFGSDITNNSKDNNAFDLANYPNPFKQITTINFKIPEKSDVTLTITDIYGKSIANLLTDKLTEGFYEIPYNAAALSSGTYIIQLTVGKSVAYKRMVVSK